MLPGSSVKTLAHARREFLRRRSPRLFAAVILAEIAWRIAIGDWTWRDPAVAAALLVVYPFGEWAIHVHILHGSESSSHAKAHRSHHRRPHDLDTVLLDPPEIGLLLGIAVPAVCALLALPFGFAPASILSGMIAGSILVATYEWMHFLIHSAYRPRTRAYRAAWHAHRLHHFKNERYWHGVTNTLADHVLGTHPDHRSVPRSPTARTLDPG